MKGSLILGVCALLLGGCTINVVDKRLSREEIVGIVKEIDQRLQDHGKAIKLVAEEVDKLNTKAKK